MQARTLSLVQALYKWAFLVCLAVLPMSHTTALRNVLLAFLLALLIAFAVTQRRQLPELLRSVHPVPWPLLAWFAFLLLFPLWAVYPDEAWANLRGQWGQSMLAWLIGFGAVWVLGRKGPGLLALALASAFPVLLHVLVALAAWLGMLGPDLPVFLSFGEAWGRLHLHFSALGLQPLPLGFWGVESMHGNLGYTACQAIAIFSVLLLYAWRAGQRRQALGAALLIFLCLISTLVASSRGAFLYAILVMLLAGGIYYGKVSRQADPASAQPSQRRFGLVIGLLGVAAVVAVLAFNAMERDIRWQTMIDKVKIALAQPDPVRLLCDGVSPQLEEKIRQDYGYRGDAYVRNLVEGLIGQDGGRILLMRVGVDLVLEHPGGLDGGRSSYMALIAEKCGHEPRLRFAHLHQSWMDLALALGWLGAALFAWLLLYFLRAGWRAIQQPDVAPWAMALALISAFWILRGFADSLYREHYLQMQAFVIAYLFGRMRLVARTSRSTLNPR